MDNRLKEHIRKNLINLIDCTGNFEVLIILLHSDGLISENEVELIKSNRDSATKLYDMYNKLMKRNCYYELIACLDGSQNHDAVNILKASPDYNPNEHQKEEGGAEKIPDFVVSNKGMTAILPILAKLASLRDQWQIICQSLVDEVSVGQLMEQKNFPVLVLETLRTWRLHKDQDATFDNLHSVIDQWNQQAARILLAEKATIREKN